MKLFDINAVVIQLCALNFNKIPTSTCKSSLSYREFFPPDRAVKCENVCVRVEIRVFSS